MSRWASTEITKLLDLQFPIIQGPMGRGSSSPQLVATVSNRGGMGSFGANDLLPADILKVGKEIRALTEKPFGMNLWVSTFDVGGEVLDQKTFDRVTNYLAPFYKELNMAVPPLPTGKPHHFDDQFEALLEVKPAVFSFVFGIPSAKILQACREHGIVTAGGASTVDEAIALEEAGVDVVVASGFEAGGHRSCFLKSVEDSLIGTFALVPQVADKVSIPVIAAGGIADGRGVAAALTLGADAVQIGTAFLACDESGTNEQHRQLLFQDAAKYTGLTRAFTGRAARSIIQSFALEARKHELEFAKYPAHSWIMATLRAEALKQGRTDLVTLWSGQAAPLIKYHRADELFDALVKETDAIFDTRTN